MMRPSEQPEDNGHGAVVTRVPLEALIGLARRAAKERVVRTGEQRTVRAG